VDERKRDSIIAYLRSRMAEFGISEAALAESLAEAPVVAPPVLSRPSGLPANGGGRPFGTSGYANGHMAAKRAMPRLPTMPESHHGAGPAFRNANGDTWDGVGDMPEWLKRAVHAGQDIEFYRV
jgi:DNA-binding protein H-NS